MPKDPSGSRPVPTIAKGKGKPKWLMNTEQGGPRSGARGTKTPTGSRPTPSIPHHKPKMPTGPKPKQRDENSNKGRSGGSSGY